MGFDFEMQNKTIELPDYYKPFYRSDPGTYQLSGTGMAMVGEIMDRSGVLDMKTPMPDLNPPIYKKIFLKLLAILGIRKLQTVEELLVQGSLLQVNVPANKFSSNDGWLITENECELIYRAMENNSQNNYQSLKSGPRCSKMKEKEISELIEEWISYNKVAAMNGGYRVC